ncbi:unnamed protein product [Closterium sp. NIES-54]
MLPQRWHEPIPCSHLTPIPPLPCPPCSLIPSLPSPPLPSPPSRPIPARRFSCMLCWQARNKECSHINTCFDCSPEGASKGAAAHITPRPAHITPRPAHITPRPVHPSPFSTLALLAPRPSPLAFCPSPFVLLLPRPSPLPSRLLPLALCPDSPSPLPSCPLRSAYHSPQIAARGPIACGIAVNDDFYKNYKGGIYNDTTGFLDVDHVITVGGWGTSPEGVKYWIGRNSWGTYWGENGWFRIVRGTNNLAIESGCDWAVPKVMWE